VDFGAVMVGGKSGPIIYIKNEDVGDMMDMIYVTQADGVDVKGPVELKKGEVAPLVLTWTPNPRAEIGLSDTLWIEGDVVIS